MRPVILCFSGLDPSGGAGLQADIETVAALGGHAAVVATALTVQDSRRVHDFELVRPALLQAQAACVLADLPVTVVKTGMLGSAATVQAVLASLADHPALPLVLDPVLAANGGGSLAREDLRQALLAALPRVSVLTPNSVEARVLAGCDDLDEAITRLSAAGARAIWLKGGHEPGTVIRNRLYVDGRLLQTSEVARLPGEYHGSGCTLAAALAAHLALGLDLAAATTASERYVGRALAQAEQAHPDGQFLPRRVGLQDA